MNLYLLRHGKAAPQGSLGPDDKRPLTLEGEQIVKRVAQGMAAMELEFDLILTSPLVRAAKTAEITARVLKTDKICTTPSLACDGNPRKLIEEINDNFGTLESVLIVGHEPYLAILMSVLISGDQGARFELKKSGLAKLHIENLRFAKCATLEWLLTPKQLQKLGKV